MLQLQQDVFTDPLTKLHNRRWLDVKLKDLLLHETPFAFLVVDIDHFKSINDELSHLVGDKAIVNVSSELASYFKFRGASCVRFGGEEFLVILENVTSDMAQMHAETYRQRIFDFPWQDVLGERGLTVSIGITLHREGKIPNVRSTALTKLCIAPKPMAVTKCVLSRLSSICTM